MTHQLNGVVLSVRDGEIAERGSYVYVWVRSADQRVLYVGATGQPPLLRTWLHLHDPDPDVGRVLARYPAATREELDVIVFALPDTVSRADIRDSLVVSLNEDGLLAADYFGPSPREDAPRSVDVAFDTVIAEIERRVLAYLSGIAG